jgi:hypothetical protein
MFLQLIPAATLYHCGSCITVAIVPHLCLLHCAKFCFLLSPAFSLEDQFLECEEGKHGEIVEQLIVSAAQVGAWCLVPACVCLFTYS